MGNADGPYLEPGSWFALGFRVAAGDEPSYLEWPDAPWLQSVAYSEDDLARVKAFKEAEAPHLAKIEAAVDTWLTTANLPLLPDAALQFFALRRQVVGCLLMSFETISDVLPPPVVTDQPRVIRKFLIDWWRRHGASYAVGYTYSEND